MMRLLCLPHATVGSRITYNSEPQKLESHWRFGHDYHGGKRLRYGELARDQNTERQLERALESDDRCIYERTNLSVYCRGSPKQSLPPQTWITYIDR
jgi:hypothetical protein